MKIGFTATLTVILLAIGVSLQGSVSVTTPQTESRIMQTCGAGEFLNTQMECEKCEDLIEHCADCTKEGICTECKSSYYMETESIRNIDGTGSRDVKICVTIPFFSRWYGILIIIFTPLIIGGLVAIIIKIVAAKKQKQADAAKMQKAHAKRKDGRTNSLTGQESRGSQNKITPMRTAENSTAQHMVRIEKSSGLDDSKKFDNHDDSDDFDEI